MPKIIKNVEKKIIDSAIQLFENNSYEEVDMKAIAKGAGIAVGTLYNYYSDKRDLFMSAFKVSWNHTIEKLEKVKFIEGQERQILKESVERLYTGIYSKRFMFHEMMISSPLELQNQLKKDLSLEDDEEQSSIIKRDLLISLEHGLADLIDKKLIKLEKGTEERFVGLIFMDIWGLVMAFPEERDKNIAFLNNCIDLIFY